MAAAIGLREDYDAAALRELAKQSSDADQTRRLMAFSAYQASRSAWVQSSMA